MSPEITAADIQKVLADLPQRRRTPVSTYRLQFHSGFGFKQAAAVVPYLARLGITDCYSSPLLKARPGSTHGYDICDHTALNPDLGSEEDFDRFIGLLHTHRMGHIVDFVPNHMGVDPETNPWWHDILENGQASPYARYFDIHWNPIKPELKGKVLLPMLGGPYGVVLEKGEIQIQFHKGIFSIVYFDQHLPIDPKQYSRLLRHNLDTLKTDPQGDPAALREYLSIMTAFDNLPPNLDNAPERVAERRREKTIAQERLARLVQASNAARDHIQKAVLHFNGQAGHPESFDALHALLETQAYRLAYWKTAFHEINYRRFFDINALAGLRIENPEVFRSTHQLTMRHIAEGKITGLRIDHPDGLYDPAGYFEALQDMFLQEWVRHALQAKPETWTPEIQETIRAWRVAERKKDPKGLAARPLYVVAEKILSHGEVLDAHWAIDGTSGYDFLNQVNGLFVDPRHAQRMETLYRGFTGKGIPFETAAYVCKKLIMSTSLASELNILAYSLHDIAERDRRSRDFTLDSLRDALKEVIACFPVYRTYINASRGGATDRDIIERAVADAKGRNPALESSIFDFVRSVLTPDNAGKVSTDEFRRQLGFTMKFQQYTGPVQAKGLEDTAFYRNNVLISLNEVGGDPRRFGRSIAEFHDANRHLQSEWTYAMSATETHDTKRGEDARVRLDVLSEIPDVWEREILRWSEINRENRTTLDPHHEAPDRNDEYLFYQALVGAWSGETTGPALRSLSLRLQAYMRKAVKEAKLHTSWVSPNEAYENGIDTFVERTMTGPSAAAFFSTFVPFAQRIARLGMLNSLSQLVLKMASPGVPDFYQGSELWDFSLVDPDNRREVDYVLRQRLFNRLEPWVNHAISFVEPALQGVKKLALAGAHTAERDSSGPRSTFHIGPLLQQWEDGSVKMFITACGLRLRQRHPALFLEGDYIPLETSGQMANHVVAFLRRYREQLILAVVPRLSSALVASRESLPVGKDGWQHTVIQIPAELRASRFLNLLTQTEVYPDMPSRGSLLVSDVLAVCPVGLLVGSL